MGFDDLRRAADRTRFDHVGIKRSLHQPLDLAFLFCNAACFPVEYGNELFADDLPLLFGIAHSRQLFHEAIGGVDRNQVQPKIVAEILLHFLELVLAQHSVVDEDARES